MVYSRERMKNRNSVIVCQLFYLISNGLMNIVFAGICWEIRDNKTDLCRQVFRANMTREECCNWTGSASLSWTPHTGSNGDIFYLKFMSPGAPECQRCHNTCSNVICGSHKICRMVDGIPQCVCKPKCDVTIKSRGTVCGTDGEKYRKYKNACVLQKYNCRKERQERVEYFGKCRRSCKRVKCADDQHCIEDQNGFPHCVTCPRCPTNMPSDPSNYLCGIDGRTYKSTCELRATSCNEGRTIRMAYEGSCQKNATCATINCDKDTCLLHPKTRLPVCVNCVFTCSASKNDRTVCGSNRQTYNSYCEMQKFGCEKGIFISTRKNGKCKKKRKNHTLAFKKTQNEIKNKGRRKDTNKTDKRRKKKRKKPRKNRKAAIKATPTNTTPAQARDDEKPLSLNGNNQRKRRRKNGNKT